MRLDCNEHQPTPDHNPSSLCVRSTGMATLLDGWREGGGGCKSAVYQNHLLHARYPFPFERSIIHSTMNLLAHKLGSTVCTRSIIPLTHVYRVERSSSASSDAHLLRKGHLATHPTRPIHWGQPFTPLPETKTDLGWVLHDVSIIVLFPKSNIELTKHTTCLICTTKWSRDGGLDIFRKSYYG